MPDTAPLAIPVELRRTGTGARWFRLAHEISEEGLLFARALPDELDGPLALVFVLPGEEEPIAIDGRAIEVRLPAPRRSTEDGARRTDSDEEDRPRKTAVRFLGAEESDLVRIRRYVEARLA